MASSKRFTGPLLSSATPETAFAGQDENARMQHIRKSLETIRKIWPSNEQYQSFLAMLRHYVKPETQLESIRQPLQRILSGFHDYADTAYHRPIRHEPEQYTCLQLYCTQDGYDYLFGLISETLRTPEAEEEMILTAAAFVEFLTIDLYNLRLSNIGDDMFANFQGITFRGLKIRARDVDHYRRIAENEKLEDRNFSIPLGLMSSTTDESVMKDFAKNSKSSEYGLHMTIHVHGVDPDLLKMYLESYPDSVVSTICAMPVARLSPFGEKEILLRGAFFHIISFQREEHVVGHDLYSLVVVMINANRDHTTESSSNEGAKAIQRAVFGNVVKASRYEVCASLAEQYSSEDAKQYRILQQQAIHNLESLRLRPKLNTTLAKAYSMKKPTWLGGSLFSTYPKTYATRRQTFRSAILHSEWSKALAILRHEFEWRLNDWFNITELKDGGSDDAKAGFTTLHILASTSAGSNGGDEDLAALTSLEEILSSSDVWKTVRTLDSHGHTAEELAIRQGNTRLARLMKPNIRHKLSSKTLDELEVKVHQVMREKAGDLIDAHQFHLPPLSILTEMEQPDLWIPIPHMHGGFNIELSDESILVKVFETVAGKTQPQITHIQV